MPHTGANDYAFRLFLFSMIMASALSKADFTGQVSPALPIQSNLPVEVVKLIRYSA